MTSSAVRTFTDPDDYAALIRNTKADMTVTARGKFTAQLIRIDVHQLWMQRFSDNLPRVGHSAGGRGRVTISFRSLPGPSLLWGDEEMQLTNIVRHAEGESTFQRSSGSASWGAMSLPIADAVAIGETFGGCDLAPPKTSFIVNPRPSALAKLRRLHAAAGDLAKEAPEIIANADAARGIEQALIEAMVACLGHPEAHETRLAQGQHAIVMRRFRRVVEENPEQPLYIPEICKLINVPSRTLRMCCQEHLGMGPKRYLVLRRLHLAPRALREANHEVTTVTDIATRFGFWQLGRFSVEYQAVFGESPSATLRQSSG
jgi:AraC-like DNA-binding protein